MSSLKQHIVIVTSEFPPQPGGIGNHAFNLALHLYEQDFEVQVIADQRSETGKEEDKFDQTLPFSITRIKRLSFRYKMYLKRVLMTRNSINQASFIIATGKFSLWNVGLLSIFRNVPTMAVIHGTEVNFKSFFLRKSIDSALKRFDKIVAVSNYTKDLVSHLNRNVNVIPNGINLSDWELTETSGFELQGKPALTTVGRVSSRKGQLNVIRQLPELIKKFPELHYHCIGIPTEAEAFSKEAKQLKVESYITFHGSVNAQTLKNMLSKTDVFVMLSSEDKSGDVEGFGIAILEANVFGVPAIGSRDCGIEDAIKPNESGELVAYDDSEQLSMALERILSHKATYQKGALNWAKQHDWANIIKEYMKLIECVH
ncbi:glycosyltransferase family 4 protein [Psychroserpens sp. AS72]|uniref:glycosyltransferase family 4 protein n=1 Tax=Psychroserpens sp. AS72 TaxID=3135775 RepID=UPI0031798705